jgi:very-short-patch-repair endonuclease
VDLADPELKIAVEADSFEHHGSRAALVRDCERYDALSAAGWTVLRFTWEHVMSRPDWVTATVRATREAVGEAITGGRRGSSERTVPT